MVNWWRRLSVPARQVFLVLGVALGLMGGMVWLTQQVVGEVQSCLDAELYRHAVALQTWFVHERYYLRDEALLLVDYDELFVWLSQGETARLRHLLSLHQHAHEEDNVYLLTADGQVYTAADTAPLTPEEVRRLPLVQQGFHGQAAAALTTVHDAIWIVAVAPHTTAEGARDAVVVIARQVDPLFLESSVGGTRGAVLLTDGRLWVQSSAADVPEAMLASLKQVASGKGGEMLQPYNVRVKGATYTAILLPLETTRTGAYALGVVRRATVLDVTRRKALTGGALLVLLFLLSAFALIAFHSRQVFRPLRALTEAARRSAAGDFETAIVPSGAGDVYELGLSVEKMRARVQELLATEQALRERLAARLEAQDTTLQQMCRARERLLGRLISAQEEERRRVSRELHDETSQEIANLIVRLGALARLVDDPEILEQLQKLRRHAAHALEGVNRIVMDLRPGLLDEYGLMPAVQWYAESRLEATGVRVAFRAEGTPVTLSPHIQVSLYRVLQEAINNIARHADASEVVVRFVWGAERLRVSVTDDGRGFEVEQVADGREGHFGLVGMRERVGLIGGTLEVLSAPGEGTRLMLDIPYTIAESPPYGHIA